MPCFNQLLSTKEAVFLFILWENWSTYSLVILSRRTKWHPQSAEDLVYINCKRRLLTRKALEYSKEEAKLCDIARDIFDSIEDVRKLEVDNLSLMKASDVLEDDGG